MLKFVSLKLPTNKEEIENLKPLTATTVPQRKLWVIQHFILFFEQTNSRPDAPGFVCAKVGVDGTRQTGIILYRGDDKVYKGDEVYKIDLDFCKICSSGVRSFYDENIKTWISNEWSQWPWVKAWNSRTTQRLFSYSTVPQNHRSVIFMFVWQFCCLKNYKFKSKVLKKTYLRSWEQTDIQFMTRSRNCFPRTKLEKRVTSTT